MIGEVFSEFCNWEVSYIFKKIRYICSANFANLRSFKVVLHKLETNFETAQPLLCNLEIAQEPGPQV